MDVIQETSNYDMFVPHDYNRAVDVSKKSVKKLRESMLKYGFSSAFPMCVTRNGGRYLKVKAGHHRLAVAKELGIPVKYVLLSDDGMTLPEMESGVTPWTLQNFLVSHCEKGKSQYLFVRRYCMETGVGVGQAIAMFSGQSASGCNTRGLDAFKAGEFEIKNSAHAERAADIIMSIKAAGVKHYNAKLLVQAISQVLFVEEMDASELKAKIKAHPYLITRQPTLSAYVEVLESVYNYHSRKKIHLAALAADAAVSRRPKGLGRKS